jgi:phosphoketolase
MDAAVVHCTEGIGIWQWASNDQTLVGSGKGLLVIDERR